VNNALTKGQRAVKRAFSSSDLVVLTMTFLTFFLATTGYFLVGFFLDETNNVTSSLVSLVFGLIGLAIVAVMFFWDGAHHRNGYHQNAAPNDARQCLANRIQCLRVAARLGK
jgi:hypothetical protein